MLLKGSRINYQFKSWLTQIRHSSQLMQMPFKSQVGVSQLQVKLKLKEPNENSDLYVSFRVNNVPRQAAVPDVLIDTHDYAQTAEKLQNHLKSQEFYGIGQVLQSCSKFLTDEMDLSVEKLNDPNIFKGADFQYCIRDNKLSFKIRNWTMPIIIGVYPQERLVKQPVVCNFTLEFANQQISNVETEFLRLMQGLKLKIESSNYQTLEALIESVATYLAENNTVAKAAHLHIRKPKALPNSNGSEVFLSRDLELQNQFIIQCLKNKSSNSSTKHKCHIALGSNIEPRYEFLSSAYRLLVERIDNEARLSPIIESDAMYYTDQMPFLNAVVELQTSLQPSDLLKELKTIESDLHREITFRNGPRTADLDIITYGHELVYTKDLIIPHIRASERPFVLQPLATLAPSEFIFSSTLKTPIEMIKDIPNPEFCRPTTPLGRNRPSQFLRYDKPLIMAILNCSPDSFSGDMNVKGENAAEKAEMLVKQGADIIDIGGASTKPGANPVPLQVELDRVIPVIKAIRNHSKDVLLSIDTVSYQVARAAIDAGCDIVNDVSGGHHDPQMLSLAEEVPLIIAHPLRPIFAKTKNVPKTNDDDIIHTIIAGFEDRLRSIKDCSRLILDPGIGFGTTFKQNLQILKRLNELASPFSKLGAFPWLVGASRKQFIGKVTGEPIEEGRKVGSTIAAYAALEGGARIVRVHDVEEMRMARDMFMALNGSSKEGERQKADAE